MPTLFGEPRRASELGRAVPKRVDLFEVTAGPQLPKPAKLRVVAANRPKVGFSVVAQDTALGPSGALAKTTARAAADALGARYLVVRAPATLRPSAASERLVVATLAELGGGGARLVFEPSGLWQRPRVRSLCAEANALFVQRLDEIEAAEDLYVRIIQIGTGRSLLGRKLDAFASAVSQSSNACIIVEGGGTAAVRTRLESELEFLRDDSTLGGSDAEGESSEGDSGDEDDEETDDEDDEDDVVGEDEESEE
jgi:hypothetical protein